MKLRPAVLCCCIGLALAPAVIAAPLGAAEVHARAVLAVATLELVDAAGAVFDLRSTVLLGAGRAVTVCEGLEEAAALGVTLASHRSEGRLIARDAQRNLCLIALGDLGEAVRPLEPQTAEARPGGRVFAISNALGLGVGISDGLIGGVRAFTGGAYIQFSAPVSPGSQGGALVDDEGRLLGIIEYRHRSGQNLNFAAPAAWIGQIEARAAASQDDNQRHAQAAELARAQRWNDLAALARVWTSEAPASPQAWRFGARAAEGLGDAVQAEAAWRTLLALEPASTPHRLGLGSALLRQGRNAEALALVEDLLARERLDAPIWLLHGQVLHAAGKSVEAEAAYRQATELDPWLLQAYSSLALLLQERGDFGAAASIWSRLSGLYPANTAFRYLLVRAHLQAGQPERAYLALARLPAEEAASATALHWSGIALGALGRPLDAIAALRRSIAAQNPAAAHSWLALSILLGELQRYPEAIAAASNALSLQSDSREARFWLAVHLKDGGRGNEALAVTEGLVASDAADPGGWRQHGFALALLGRRKEAIQALERSLELDPKQGKVWAALVEVCHADGQEVAARRAYEHLRSVDPEYARKTYQTVIATYEEQGL